MEKNWNYAQLSEEEIKQLQALESKLGKTLIAFEKRVVFAKLTEEQLNQIQALEKELGLYLLAYQPV
ncbi:MAG: hypothetical protein JW750_07425 [Anaerolineaceae bacterium]|nr:hypothetical protein [Anaerolineaceae bacterium]